MVFTTAILATLALVAHASSVPGTVDPLKTISIAAPDGSIKADFIPFGATATNLWVKDKNGKFRDILLGFDNKTLYTSLAEGRDFFSPVVGRYANRIRNGTFTIPISKDAQGPGKKFQIVENEHNGTDTLHGGLIGYDQRPWKVVKQTKNSVAFTLVDPNADFDSQGFPGTVVTTIDYTLEAKSTWQISIHAAASQLTPIMLSTHNYINLDAYDAPANDLVDHVMRIQSDKIVATDGNLIPNGKFIPVQGTPLDFRTAKSIGANINATAAAQYCGTGCVGFDNCWIYDDKVKTEPVFSIWSTNSGIKLDVTTNQPALQIYTCNGIFNPDVPIPRKASQGGPSQLYTDHSCIVVEQESYIDAINNPEFGVNQIYGPGRDYNWEATYSFSVLK
ncbi:galactose mutarotase-like domain-containing protein [Mycena amicta]|nr:galactose mutarotase-like domain-containing protein [Mycena amicta]